MQQTQKLHQLTLAALFAAAIAVVTAYVLHIPLPTGGYIHIGDALIYLAACLLPLPYAVGAAAIGAGLADLLTAPMWVLPTLIIKAIIVLPFTKSTDHILCGRNIAAIFVAGLISPVGYGLASAIMYGTMTAFLPQVLGTLVQSVGSGLLFVVFAIALDKSNLKSRISLS